MKKLSLFLFLAVAGLGAFAQEPANSKDSSRVAATRGKHRNHDKAERKKQRLEMMKALNLTPEQDAQIKVIRDENKSKKMAVHSDVKLTDAEKKEQLKEIHKGEATAINAILTTEQMAKMKSMRQEMKAKRKQHKAGKNAAANPPA